MRSAIWRLQPLVIYVGNIPDELLVGFHAQCQLGIFQHTSSLSIWAERDKTPLLTLLFPATRPYGEHHGR